jgi:hypothetical protein
MWMLKPLNAMDLIVAIIILYCRRSKAVEYELIKWQTNIQHLNKPKIKVNYVVTCYLEGDEFEFKTAEVSQLSACGFEPRCWILDDVSHC